MIHSKEEFLAEDILNAVKDRIIVIDMKGRIRSCNKAWLQQGGALALNWQGENYIELCEETMQMKEEDVHMLLHGMRKLYSQTVSEFKMEYALPTESGESWFSLAAVPLHPNKHEPMFGLVISISDITERKEMELKLRIYSTKDPLTDLYNRRYLEDKMNEKLQTTGSEVLSVLMIDIDNFKGINDDHGHQIGDIVLIELSKCLSDNVRKNDVCTRYGGDEFLIYLPETSHDEVHCFAERIYQYVKQINVPLPDGDPLHFNVSIGIVTAPTTVSSQQLLKEVDKALYQAKKLGRNQIYQAVDLVEQ
ncbi:sensor domain-containing diguanylate cyclase [Bacillus solitudinis]|uniref:sensor domain-containing diguanylate cyclase n=1 Tax=Bacillus solitudinis TaxID=2014074 RepID=UPI000C25089C|nr:GGDEF domain-containing protein [Bacillus solitudinis]